MWSQSWHHFFENAEARIRANGARAQSLREALLAYWRSNPPQKKTSEEDRSPDDAYCENIGFTGKLRKR